MSGLSEFEKHFVKPKEGRTLIVGSKLYGGKEDRRKRYSDAVGVDMFEGDGVDIVADLEDSSCVEALTFSIEKTGQFEMFSHVECMSVLEHSRRPWLLAANLEKLMEPGATIFVSVPWIWRLHSYPDDYWRLNTHTLQFIFPNIEWVHLKYAATDHVTHKSRSASLKDPSGAVFLERTEACGFGVRK